MVKVLTIRIREKGRKGPASFEYKNQISLNDPKQLGLIFFDFERYGANIEKAFREFQREKADLNFPF